MKKAIVLFDGDCRFCNATVNYIIKYDKNDEIRFASQQNDIGIKIMNEAGILNNNLSTIILIKDQKVFSKSNALIEICKLLVGLPRIFILTKIIPVKIRDYFYDFFSKHRYTLFGKKTQCIIPSKEVKMKFID